MKWFSSILLIAAIVIPVMAEAKPEEMSTTARWEGSKLVTSRSMGPRVTETYEVSSDRSRLTITTIVTHGDGETTTIKRVYDAAK